MKFRASKKLSPGIALFVLMSSLVLIALAMKELIQVSSSQANRARNFADRIQATYLARSTLNLSRFFLIFDRYLDTQLKKGEASDTLTDIWAQALPFPIPIETIRAATGAAEKGENIAEAAKEADEKADGEGPKRNEDPLKKCENFFEDFVGTATSETHDLSALINLNDLDESNALTFQVFVQLLSPNVAFMQAMNDRGLNPEALAREIRDYADRNEIEDVTKGSELTPYSAAQLDYAPKNRPYMFIDELKMVPDMDDEIYEYLSTSVSALFISNRKKPALINLNTVDKNVFQALLRNTSNPEEVAEKFMKDRKENKRVYTNTNLTENLKNLFSLDQETIQKGLLTGVSDAFRIDTEADVNDFHLKLETFVSRIAGSKKPEPIVLMRVSP